MCRCGVVERAADGTGGVWLQLLGENGGLVAEEALVGRLPEGEAGLGVCLCRLAGGEGGLGTPELGEGLLVDGELFLEGKSGFDLLGLGERSGFFFRFGKVFGAAREQGELLLKLGNFGGGLR